MTHSAVMAGHSRPKDGVASLAYVPAIHAFDLIKKQGVDARDKRGHDESTFNAAGNHAQRFEQPGCGEHNQLLLLAHVAVGKEVLCGGDKTVGRLNLSVGRLDALLLALVMGRVGRGAFHL